MGYEGQKRSYWQLHLAAPSPRSRHVAKHSLTRTRACLNPILHCSTTISLSSLESCLHVFNQTAKKLHPATLDEVTPYVNTQRFLPPPWNDMTHGVQQLCGHHIHQTLDGGDPCPLGRLNFLACGTNHSRNIAKKGRRELEEGVRGTKSEVAHLWARWLRDPCRLGDPHRCRAGG